MQVVVCIKSSFLNYVYNLLVYINCTKGFVVIFMSLLSSAPRCGCQSLIM
jgi:hypothetical protein